MRPKEPTTVLAAAFLTLSMQGAQPPGAAPPKPGPVVLDCAFAMSQAADALASLVCRGDEQIKLGEAAPKGSSEQHRRFEDAVTIYRKAESSTSAAAMKAAALEMLVRLYDTQHLNEPAQVERVLRELAAVTPNDLTVLFRLSKVQEDQQELDAAETTLLSARHARPAAPEPNKMLAQFYTRRVTEMSTAAQQVEAQLNPVLPGQRDKDGFYHPGGDLQAPHKLETGPPYPEGARNAGVSGAVVVELSVDETGTVRGARIVQSIPLLDAAALETVKRWHYEPTVVNGRPVPIKMTVTVNFTLPRQ
jgi:TonB family protein